MKTQGIPQMRSDRALQFFEPDWKSQENLHAHAGGRVEDLAVRAGRNGGAAAGAPTS